MTFRDQLTMPMASDEIEIAQARVDEARRNLDGTLNLFLQRLRPIAVAGEAISRARSRHINWISIGLGLYRYRATAMTIIGSIATMRARKKAKQEAMRQQQGDKIRNERLSKRAVTGSKEGHLNMSDSLKDTADQAREKIKTVADAAVEKATEASLAAGEKLSDSYERTKAEGVKLRDRLVDGVRQNPVSAIAGGIAFGVLIGTLLPRPKLPKTGTDNYRQKISSAAKGTLVAVGERLDGLGATTETAREGLNKARDKARDVASHAADAARDALSRVKRGV